MIDPGRERFGRGFGLSSGPSPIDTRPMRLVAWTFAGLFVGCVAWSSREPVAGENGNDWVIRCHLDDAACNRQARKACPDGFDVLEKDKAKMLRIHCKGASAPLVYSEEDD